MSDTAFNPVVEAEAQTKRRSRLRAVFSKDRKAQFGLVVLVLFILGAFLAPVLAPYDPNEMTLNMMSGPSGDNMLGTDDLGRDLFSRILWGTQISLFVGVATVALALVFGVLLGV
ncbi:MAG TPA: ABC transporter permease, partial [Gammaproteobacteria bacterium]|nr:ABC transporter permease [Gammaproteobacteria bacterium]